MIHFVLQTSGEDLRSPIVGEPCWSSQRARIDPAIDLGIHFRADRHLHYKDLRGDASTISD